MNLYNIPLDVNITKVLACLISNNYTKSSQEPYLIITPNKKASNICKEDFTTKNISLKKIKIIAISETPELLKEFYNKSPDFLRYNINTLLTTKVITPSTRTFLISNLIKNIKLPYRGGNLILFSNNLAHILDILESEDISLEKLTTVPVGNSAFSDSFYELLIAIYPHWKKILLEFKLCNILCYRAKVFNLLAKIVAHLKLEHQFNIITFGIDNYSSSTINFLATLINYKLGKILFNEIDFSLPEKVWEGLNYTHPQYINKQILNKLNISRKYIQPIEVLLSSNPTFNELVKEIHLSQNSSTPEITRTFFNPIRPNPLLLKKTQPPSNKGLQLNLFNNSPHNPINKPSVTFPNNLTYLELENEDEEASTITNIIADELKRLPHKNITLITTNKDLIKRIAFKLSLLKIPFDNSSGSNLSKTKESIFFTLVSKLDINKVDFVDLLSLLKHPLCRFASNMHYIYLIDLYLSREITYYSSLEEYTKILTKLLSNKTINEEEYLGIKNILISLITIYTQWQNLNNSPLNFNEILNLHMKIAEDVCINSTETILLWESKNGQTLKQLLDEVKEETQLLSPLSLKEYHDILLTLISQHTIRNLPEEDLKVYIGGTLQAQFIANHTIIIGDMNEGSFPSHTQQEPPFISYLFQKLNLPHTYDNIAKEALIFQKLCYNEKLYITRSIKKLSVNTTPSKFLIKLFNTLNLYNIKLNNFPLASFNLSSLAPPTKVDSGINKNYKTKIEINVPLNYRPKKISATAIEKLIQNPYVYFIENILKLKPILPLNPPFNNLISGNLIHQILEKFFNSYNNKPLINVPQIEKALVEIAQSVFFLYFKKYPSAVITFHIFKHWVTDLAQQIYNLGLETFFHCEIKGEINILEEANLNISGIADCLALTPQGAFIIDFKTGSQTNLSSDINKYKKQLFILGYCFLNKGFKELNHISYNINNIEYWVIPNSFKNSFHNISLSQNLKTTLIAYINEEMEHIKKILQIYLNTETPFTLNLNHTNMIEEYIHFSRKDEFNI